MYNVAVPKCIVEFKNSISMSLELLIGEKMQYNL